LVDLAALGGLSGDRPVVYSATYASDEAALRRQIRQPDAVLVVTDSNRKRARRWGAIKDVEGATERADQSALTTDEADNRLDLFPDAGTGAATVVVSPGARVSTTRYGNRITYWQEERGSRAFDGDPSTAWEFGTHDKVIGERLRLDLDTAITTDHVNLVQRLHGVNDRYITKLTLTFDGKEAMTVDLDASSRTAGGQTVSFPKRTFHRIEFTVADTNVGDNLDGPVNNVGLAEIRLRDNAPGAQDVHVDEIVRMPTDLVTAAGRSAINRPLVFEMARSRTVVVPPRTAQDEPALVRQLRVPSARSFWIGATVRLATAAPDDVLDAVLGLPGADAGGLTVTASQHLPGVRARGSQAFDGDPATAWSTAFGDPTGQWVDVRTPSPVTFDRLNLEIVNDGRHSVPTQLRIDAGGDTRTFDLPAVRDQSRPNGTVTVPVHFDPLTGDDVKVTITKVRATVTTEYHEIQPITMPVALAEVGIPGVQRAPLPAQFPRICRTDLLTVDGKAVAVHLNGDPARAAAGDPVDLALGPCSGPFLSLSTGDHVVRTAQGTTTGIDVDGLTLASSAAGGPMTLGPGGALGDTAVAKVAVAKVGSPGTTPRVRVEHNGRTKLTLHVEGATPGSPFWVVLGESNSSGWQATVAGSDVGGSTLVDGYANGWLINPKLASFGVTLEWTPQRQVWIALAISGAALLLCLFLALRRRRPSQPLADAGALDDEPIVANPLLASGVMPSRGVLAATVLGTGVLGAVLVRGWVGLLAAALVAAVMLRPRLRWLLTFGAPTMLAFAGLYTVVQQYRYRY
ncbi:MAG TPA: discoidin domain-containing protein, partial [Acidimicrobiia bacterium]